MYWRTLILVVALLSVWSKRAEAFCRTTVCDPAGASCSPDASGCSPGEALQWPLRCIGVSLHEAASKQVAYADFDRVVRAAFGAWNSVDCGGSPPSVSVEVLGPISCGQRGFNQNKGNANIILFLDDAWPYPGAGSVLALTTVTFNSKTGVISDADMEINASPSSKGLTTSDTGVQSDLQSILTHEAGHFLGLAHTLVQDATMFAVYEQGTTALRDLSDDDKAAICAAYPPDRAGLGSCDPKAATPASKGFSALCTGDDAASANPTATTPVTQTSDDDGSCAVAQSAPRKSPSAPLWLLALAGLLGARTSTRRGTRRSDR